MGGSGCGRVGRRGEQEGIVVVGVDGNGWFVWSFQSLGQ